MGRPISNGHGTRSSYARGCHCPECTEANRVYHARWRGAFGSVPCPSPGCERTFRDAWGAATHVGMVHPELADERRRYKPQRGSLYR